MIFFFYTIADLKKHLPLQPQLREMAMENEIMVR